MILIRMIEKYIDILNRVRSGETDIREYYYKEGIDTEGYSYDEHAVKRNQLLLAMQYDRNPGDLHLLKDMMQQEITMHENAPFQGIESSLRLVAWLLAKYRLPENAWLFIKAKRSNFDTHCGFDYEYIVSAGIEETYAYVDNTEHELKELFYEYVGPSVNECYINKEELSNWYRMLDGWYKEEPVFDDIDEEITLAYELRETEVLKEKVAEWKAAQKDWDKTKLNTLYYYEGLADNTKAQIAAREQLYELEGGILEKTIALADLAKLWLRAGNPSNAFLAVNAAGEYMDTIPRGWTSNGRFLLETAFDIILEINNAHDKTAQQTYQWATTQVEKVEGPHISLLKKVTKATILMGDAEWATIAEKAIAAEEQAFKDLEEGKIRSYSNDKVLKLQRP